MDENNRNKHLRKHFQASECIKDQLDHQIKFPESQSWLLYEGECIGENDANLSEWNSSSVYICATFVLLFKGKGYNRIQWIHDLERGLCLSCTVSKHVIISKQVCFLELLNLRTHNFPKLYLEFFYNVTFIWEAHIHLIVRDRAWWENYIKIVQKCKYKSSRKKQFYNSILRLQECHRAFTMDSLTTFPSWRWTK